jgi:hypothetical protein
MIDLKSNPEFEAELEKVRKEIFEVIDRLIPTKVEKPSDNELVINFIVERLTDQARLVIEALVRRLIYPPVAQAPLIAQVKKVQKKGKVTAMCERCKYNSACISSFGHPHEGCRSKFKVMK